MIIPLTISSPGKLIENLYNTILCDSIGWFERPHSYVVENRYTELSLGENIKETMFNIVVFLDTLSSTNLDGIIDKESHPL